MLHIIKRRLKFKSDIKNNFGPFETQKEKEKIASGIYFMFEYGQQN